MKVDGQYNGKGTVSPGGEFMVCHPLAVQWSRCACLADNDGFKFIHCSNSLFLIIPSNHKACSDASKLACMVEARLCGHCDKSEHDTDSTKSVVLVLTVARTGRDVACGVK